MDIKDAKSCDKLYNKLAKDLLFHERIWAQDFVINLFKTEKCDHYKDLKHLRDKYEQQIGKEDLERILHHNHNYSYLYKETSLQMMHDDIICEVTIAHHYYFTKKSIESCLPWKTWFYYKLQNL